MTIEENIYQQICSGIIRVTCTRDIAIYVRKPLKVRSKNPRD